MKYCFALGLLLSAAVTAAAEPAPVSVICVEADTGHVFEERNASVVRPPASMIKLMLMLLAAEGLDAGRWQEETPIPVSAHAAGMGGTQVYLAEGETFPLSQMMEAVAVASANDAAMAVGEALWGSEAAYLEAANARARRLGMKDTVLRSIHGLPPDPGELPDATTAHDMALLARACAQSPRLLAWSAQGTMVFRPGEQEVYNTNKLLWRLDGCDGLKTGYIRAAGFCLTATAVRDGVRLVCVVMGAPAYRDRYNECERLIERAFARIIKEDTPPVLQTARNGSGEEPDGFPPVSRAGVTDAVVQPEGLVQPELDL